MTARLGSLGVVLVVAVALVETRQQPFDLVLRNGRVIDGTGSPWFRADVAVRGDTIVAVGRVLDTPSGRVVDLAGQVIAPGFIDVHTHARRGLAQTPTADNYVRQGVTTVIEGPDGSSAVPIGPFLDEMSRLAKSVNVASFIGQGSIRSSVMGSVNRAATPEELTRMVALTDQGMRDGALGLSTGLFYVPGSFTPTSEVIELAKVAGRYGGIHQSHQRDDASKVLDSVRETIAIGEGGGLATQVTHMKTVGQANWGKSADALRLVDEARARGVDVTIDQYPYTASSTSVSAALLPAWALEGSRQAQLQRLDDPASRTKMKAESVAMIRDERGGGDAKNVQFANCSFDTTLNGRTLADLVARRKLAPTLENAAEMVMWIHGQGGCQGIFHAMSEDDLVRILAHPATMVASDGEVPVFGRNNPHPRSYGTFPRVLGRYVRDQKVIALEEAVRKMTAFPAARIGFRDRGLIRVGMKADLAVFDPTTVRDRATFDQPHQYAEGVSLVVVNGQVVFDGKAMTAARPGVVLYGAGKR